MNIYKTKKQNGEYLNKAEKLKMTTTYILLGLENADGYIYLESLE